MTQAAGTSTARRPVRIALALLLVVHAIWLAWSATWQSPTLNEPGHLASGLAYWSLGRFEPYAVNPPLVRLVAALPVIAVGYNADWSDLRAADQESVPKFLLGSALIDANGRNSQRLFVLARWACIPFSVLGAWMCFLWGRTLFGDLAGLFAAGLWCVEPNIIAHGQLLTPDVAATSLGLAAMWFFWCWIQRKSLGAALLAGASLAFAILAKSSWLILFGIWPVLWLVALLRHPTSSKAPRVVPELLQLSALFLTSVYVINAAYAFDGSFSRLDSFEFASSALTGRSPSGTLGNRYSGTLLGGLRVPFPRQFLLGLDLQKKDFERFPHQSYLHGEWRQGGWWYYYLYAAAVKVPLGLWLLGLTAIVMLTAHSRRSLEGSSQQSKSIAFAVLLAPALILFGLVSSQTAFNHHFRYVLPCFGPAFVLIGGVVSSSNRLLVSWAVANWSWIAVSSALTAPFSLSYFNELSGGMHNGSAHLLHSNIDWGQDLVALNQWIAEHPEAKPLHLAYYGFFNPVAYGVDAQVAPQGPFWGEQPRDWSFRPGWYAVSVNYLHGTAWRMTNRHAYEPLCHERPVAWCGGSIAIFRVDGTLAQKLTNAVLGDRD